MKEFVISDAQTEKAVLVGLITQTQNERKTNEYLDELAFLAETAGAEVVKRFTQKIDTPNSVTYVGKGKLQEIKEYLAVQNESEDTEIGMVIFDDELSAKQRERIEREDSGPDFIDFGHFCNARADCKRQDAGGTGTI